jgi:hypothetical protein
VCCVLVRACACVSVFAYVLACVCLCVHAICCAVMCAVKGVVNGRGDVLV